MSTRRFGAAGLERGAPATDTRRVTTNAPSPTAGARPDTSNVHAGWSGPQGIFAWVHLPANGLARGGVVCCPPLGAELNWGYPSMRLMADELAARGFAVVRFDYAGSGHAAGDLTAAWPEGGLTASLDQAVSVLRSTGATRLSLVGARLGGTIATTWACEHGGIDDLVLWDPSISGKVFLHEQRALRILYLNSAFETEAEVAAVERATGGVEIPGFVYPPEGAEDIRSHVIDPAAPPRARRTLVIHRSAGASKTLKALIASTGADAMSAEAIEEILRAGRVPTGSVVEVCDWLAAGEALESTPVVAPPLDTDVAITTPAGTPVRERVRTLGPVGLFGIETYPAEQVSGAPEAGGPTVIFLEVALEPCIGPGRLWVTAARSLAAAGVTSVRYNSSGLGDSPVRDGQPRNVLFAGEALDDATDVAATLRPLDPSRVVLVGLCSGAYNALEAGLRLGAAGVCAINPVLDGVSIAEAEDLDGVRMIVTPRRGWARRLGEHPIGDKLRRRLPEAGWRLLDALSLVRSPAHGIEPLADAGSDVLLICGKDDGRRFADRGGWITRRLVDGGHLHFELLVKLDHALLLQDQQQTVKRLLVDHVLGATG